MGGELISPEGQGSITEDPMRWNLLVLPALLLLISCERQQPDQAPSNGTTVEQKTGQEGEEGSLFNSDQERQEPPIVPQVEKVILEVAGKEVKAVLASSPWRWEKQAGNLRIRVEKDRVTALAQAGGDPLWIARSDNGAHLSAMLLDEQVAYFQGYRVDARGYFKEYDSPSRVRRLDLDSGQWLKDLPIGSEKPSGQAQYRVISVLTGDGWVVKLGAWLEPDARVLNEQVVAAFDVTAFRGNQTSVVWSKRFPSTGERPYTGGYLWAPRVPQYAGSAVQHLNWMGEALLVCAEAMQPILCLNRDTGTELWRCERIWEFQRGFIGPSVWSHYINRFGLDKYEENPSKTVEARKRFEKQYHCSIIAGPVAVPLDAKRDTDTHSIFIAVSRGPTQGFTGYLSDCVVYELDDGGKPVSMVKVPQIIRGSPVGLVNGGLVWSCQNDGFIRLISSSRSSRLWMGPGGPDLLTRISWFRQLSPLKPHAWLVSDRGGYPVAFSDTYAFALPAGGYVRKKGDQDFRFPISVIDLQTGIDRTITLRVPFEGELPIPDTNFRTIRLADGGAGIGTWGPHILALSGLQVEGTNLEVALGMEAGWTGSIRFDLSALGLLGAAPKEEDAQDMLEARINALSDVNAKDERGNTPLILAAQEMDVDYIKALLGAGANIHSKSNSGLTALMAATGGALETVDLLIKAGSDVNARGKSGITALIYAAGDQRESKRKVRLLLEAGADVNAATNFGTTSLSSAARAGNIAALELLIREGADASHRSDEGQTALMAAARSGNETLLSIFLQAGVDVNAQDNNGMTALMQAVDGFCSAGGIKALLDAGADLDLRDRQGRTALMIARASNSLGAERRAKILEEAEKEP